MINQRLADKQSVTLKDSLRKTRAELEVASTELNRVKCGKPPVNDGKVNKTISQAQDQRLANSLRETRIKVEIAATELKNVSERRDRYTTGNAELERVNDNLVATNKKLEEMRASLSEDVKKLKDRIDLANNENEAKIALRLSEIDRLAEDHRKAIQDTDKDRAALKDEINSHIRQKKELEADQEKLLTLQVELKMKIDAAEKDNAKAKQFQVSWTNKIADLKNEENRVEILRLRVLKMINDNKSIKELAELRKELLK